MADEEKPKARRGRPRKAEVEPGEAQPKRKPGRPKKQPSVLDHPEMVTPPTPEELRAFIQQEENAILQEEGKKQIVGIVNGDVPTIEIDYTPRPIWARELHRIMDTYRFVVLVAHRRFGKTVGLINQIIKMAVECDKVSPRFAYIAPWKTQAKQVAWDYLTRYTANIPGVKINKSDLVIELESKHENAAGAKIFILGADNPDILRGNYLDGVILDEYAQMPENFFGEIIRPLLADRKGKCFFIGTPKGQNNLYERYMKAKDHMAKAEELRLAGKPLGADGNWYAALYSVDMTHVVDEQELADARADMTELEYRQEFMCDFTAAVYNSVISLDTIESSAQRTLTQKDILPDEPVIMGVDIARFGDDRTTMWKRQGLFVAQPKVFKGLDTMQVVDQIVYAIGEWKPDAVFIDGGNMGAGVIDRLHQLGYNEVFEVPFGSAALSKERYENIRAEMYFKCKEWMEHGGAIPNMSALKHEFSKTEYKYSKRGRIILVPKEEIKKLTGKSPDLADGLVLTFAKPVRPKNGPMGPRGRQAKYMCNTEYSVFEELEAG